MAARNSAVAGAFYPSDKAILSKTIEEFLRNKAGKSAPSLELVHGIIVPHAGYLYSGSTAGRAYQHILGKKYTRVIILCPNHTIFLNKVAFDSNAVWKTPLGDVPVDTEAISKLDKNLFLQSPTAHSKEHAIEVQLPFLQKTLKDFKIVPLIVGTIHNEDINKAAEEILKIINHETLLVISTDLSHFMHEHEAEKIDSKTIKGIISLDSYSELDACGSYALKVFQVIAKKKKWTPKLIEYTNSGKVTGNNAKVVGYASFWF
ncbi:MAG: AmmeMemoRadiSam system protein B [Candidatus Nanoarchaeia archaeon]